MLSIRTWHGKWFYDAVGKSLWCGTYNSKFCLVEKWRFLVWVFVFTFEEWHSIQVWFLVTNPDKKRTTLLKLPLAQKGGTLPSWRSSSCRGPFVHPFMPVPSSSPLIKIRVPTNSGASMVLWLNLIWLTSRLFPLHRHLTIHTQYTSHHHTAWSQKYYTGIYRTCQCGISACRPACLLNRAVELNSRAGRSKFQLSYSYNAGEPAKKHVPIPSVVLLKDSN